VLNPVGEELWTVEGPIVSFYSFPYPTRMAIAQLANRQLWLWSPIALTSELAEELEKLGESLIAYPPMQKGAAFGIENVKAQIKEAIHNQRGN
jgi:hypothetical protein